MKMDYCLIEPLIFFTDDADLLIEEAGEQAGTEFRFGWILLRVACRLVRFLIVFQHLYKIINE